MPLETHQIVSSTLVGCMHISIHMNMGNAIPNGPITWTASEMAWAQAHLEAQTSESAHA